ncbi:hypothetical protein SAMN05216548_114124 [Faunimonas pinastri]|uniref:Uncharacterized protein n=1 Tax=Faunimonas pinastri TaxID=1855383 RepID=A0A1H9MZV4_9HYPH|nr:hypothetical protein [Faunimonas pinastri]SER29260.1 hypothetical protein SAMN05216548_114124 [Faunimonas pinastri]
MRPVLELELRPFPGSELGDVAEEMHRIANLTGLHTVVSFNGVRLRAVPGKTTPEMTVKSYMGEKDHHA